MKIQQVGCCFFLVVDVVVPLCSLLCASRLHAMCVCVVVVDSGSKRTVEEREREAKKGRRIRERAFLHANATNKVRLACIF